MSAPLPPLHRQVRWWILLLLLAVTIINFVDRQALSLVAPILRDELRLSNTDYGAIVSAFMFGMMLGEFPMGWVMDRFGPRRGLAFAVLSWSIAQAMHAFARTGLHLGVFRFWLGSGECGNYSGGVKVVSQWFPPRERAFAVGVFNGGSTLGSMIAPPLITAIAAAWGWRMAFLIPSAFGFVWLVAWWRVYRAPGEHPRLGEAERRHITSGGEDAGPPPPSRTLLRHPQTWALMLCRFLVGPVVQFYMFWIPEYLFRVRGLSLKDIGYFVWIPFLFGDVGSIGGGLVAGWLMKRGASARKARTVTLLFGATLCLGSAAVALAHTAPAAIAAICLVLFGHYFLSANMFTAISDLFPSTAVARVTALTGIAGGLSGMLFPAFTGFMVDRVSYLPVFLIASVMPLAGVVALLLVSRGLRPVGR